MYLLIAFKMRRKYTDPGSCSPALHKEGMLVKFWYDKKRKVVMSRYVKSSTARARFVDLFQLGTRYVVVVPA